MWTPTPHWLCCSTEVQTALWSSGAGVSASEDDTEPQGFKTAGIFSLLHYKYMVRKHNVEKIKGKEIKAESFPSIMPHREASKTHSTHLTKCMYLQRGVKGQERMTYSGMLDRCKRVT